MATDIVSSVEAVRDLDSWQQMTGEGDIAYASFKAYVTTGLTADDGLRRHRDMGKVIRTSAVGQAILERWREQYMWDVRARAYDLYIAEVKLQALAKRSNLYDEARTDLAALVAIEARRLLFAAKAGEQVLSPKDTIKGLELLVKLERLTEGKSTENVAVAASGDLRRLTDDEAETLYALLSKSGG